MTKGADRYAVSELERYDQRNNVYFRAVWDPSLVGLGKKYYGIVYPRDRAGFRLEDMSFSQAGWYAEQAFAMGNLGGRRALYSWESPKIFYSDYRPPPGARLDVEDPARNSHLVKQAGRFYGASLVGTSRLDRRWLYSHLVDVLEKKHEPVEIPEEFKYAIVLAFEMDHQAIKYSPSHIGAAAATTGYGKMAFTTGTLAQFIRYLGFKALPMGNDTALSIPLAIDAGLGELSRMGLLITPQYGPRVRLSKILTDLPLVADSPIEFGVWDFCEKCEKCAHFCPGQAIMRGGPTDQALNASNRQGLLRWPLNAEKCFGYWASIGGFCSCCVRVCPFNKAPGWLHNAVRWGINHTRWLDPLFVKADDWLGYGRQSDPASYWEDN